MMGMRSLLFLVSLLRAAASSQRLNVTMSSRYMSDQILPCTAEGGEDIMVRWYKGDAVVHAYYYGRDRLIQQIQQLRNRTFLFHDQLSRGNASLLLKEVQVSDRGLYTCYTSNSRGRQESSVNLEVEAPVTKVSIVQEGDTITCRSEGLYPEPQVTWSRNKPADTRIEQTEQQLYNIRSSVRLDDHVDYTCHFRTLRSNWSTTLTTARCSILSEVDDSLDCPALKSPLTSVTWRFNDSIIVQREDHLTVSERWRDHVKGLSTSGRLTLQNLSPDLSGLYTCEVTNEEETHVERINVKVAEKSRKPRLLWILLLLPILFVVALVHHLLQCFYLKHQDNPCGARLRDLTPTPGHEETTGREPHIQVSLHSDTWNWEAAATRR